MNSRRPLPPFKDWVGFIAGMGIGLSLLASFGVLTYVLLVFFVLVALTGAGFTAHLLVHRYRQAHPKKVVSWPLVAELEHATGVFDEFTRLGWAGHDAAVGDACAACARARIRGEQQLEPPHGGFNTPCDCADCRGQSEAQAACSHPRKSVVKGTSRTIDGVTVRVEYACRACGAENIPAGHGDFQVPVMDQPPPSPLSQSYVLGGLEQPAASVEVWVQGPCPLCGNKIDRKGYYDPREYVVTVDCSRCGETLRTRDLSDVPSSGARVIVRDDRQQGQLWGRLT